MWGRFGAFVQYGTASAGGAQVLSLENGPSERRLARVRRLGLDEFRDTHIPTLLELECQALGEKLLDLTTRAGLVRGRRAVGGRVYRIFAGHQRRLDDIAERAATAWLQTGAHDVIAAGGDAGVERGPVDSEVLQQFKSDFPALVQGYANLATQKFLEDYEMPRWSLRKVAVAVQNVGQAVIDKKESRILAVFSLVAAMTVPGLPAMGASKPVEVGVCGLAAIFAQSAVGASDADIARSRRIKRVRRHLGRYDRSIAINELSEWARGMIIAREKLAQPVATNGSLELVIGPRVGAPAVLAGQ